MKRQDLERAGMLVYERLGVGKEDDPVGRRGERLELLAGEGIEDCGELVVLADILADGYPIVEHSGLLRGDGL